VEQQSYPMLLATRSNYADGNTVPFRFQHPSGAQIASIPSPSSKPGGEIRCTRPLRISS
jgi:hypothetical protein